MRLKAFFIFPTLAFGSLKKRQLTHVALNKLSNNDMNCDVIKN